MVASVFVDVYQQQFNQTLALYFFMFNPDCISITYKIPYLPPTLPGPTNLFQPSPPTPTDRWRWHTRCCSELVNTVKLLQKYNTTVKAEYRLQNYNTNFSHQILDLPLSITQLNFNRSEEELKDASLGKTIQQLEK